MAHNSDAIWPYKNDINLLSIKNKQHNNVKHWALGMYTYS